MPGKRNKILLSIVLAATTACGAILFEVIRTRANTERSDTAPSDRPAGALPDLMAKEAALQDAGQGRLSRNLSLQPEALNLARRLGRRLSSTSREQFSHVGVLTVGNQQRALRILRKQTDDGERVEISLAGAPGLLTWDTDEGARTVGARPTRSDRALIERLVLDSPDQFILAQLRGASYYTVAMNVRPSDAPDGYSGPLWNIVRVHDPQSDAEKKPESAWRLYYVNARTGLIDKIVSEVRGEKIEAAISGWTEQNGEQVPAQITWTKQGETLMQYQLTNFARTQ